MRRVLCTASVVALFVCDPSFAQSDRWNGLYVGLNGGYGVGSASFDENASFTSTGLGSNGLLSGSGENSMTGAVLGTQAGYNWQLSGRWLVGAEADWQWTSQKGGNNSCTPPGTAAFFGAGGNGFGYCLSNQQEISNFGTARLRAGALVRESLWYLTGGLAWGTVKDRVTFTSSSNPAVLPFGGEGPFNGTGSFSSTKMGWTIGLGIETKIDAGWSVKLEYLHADLGTRNETLVMNLNPTFGPITLGDVATTTIRTRVTDDLVRIGLSYQFGR